MKEKSVTHAGGSIGYWEEGSGFPVVFIHGFPMDHMAWIEFVAPFAKNYRIILPDNPGFGKSSLPDADLSIEFYADCVKEILDAEKISGCIIIGHSMGGYITLNFASRFPEYLKGFGMIHSTAYADDEAKKRNRIEVAEAARKSDAASFVHGMLPKLFGEKYSSVHEKEITELKSYFGKAATTESIAQASLAMGKRVDTTNVLKKTNTPVLFIIGKDDKAIPADKSISLTHLPDRSVVSILEDVAHMGMFEARQKADDAVQQFLKLCV